ncbi:MAG TPA: heparan-alpha-glucosaminide N-acetyltransferase domain-containing protein [Candidatus Acidoferrum sp.]|nr:heparan-alpha-glucosaminide N-acetyltransferase domain-containing protein [Candidatus Acidoferrum sp.]
MNPTGETSLKAGPGGRLESIDFLRGLVMVVMAIDHTRDYFTRLWFEPENLEMTWGALFFTRWITHFCAPLFFFLAGTGAFFYGMRRTPAELTKFLWTRGLWLIVLEFTVVGTAWTFKFPWGFFGVIWALGASMVILSVVVRLPLKWITILSAAVILLHDLADRIRPARFGEWAWAWNILHVKGGANIFGWGRFVLFPLIPWCAVMTMGYLLGALMQRSDRRVWIMRLGVAMTIAFVLLRLTNLYGNPPALPGGVTPGDWHTQATLSKTLILFFDTEKYPASLQFLLMTMGPSLLLLGWLDGRKIARPWQPITVFGRVPMLFYLLHLYLIHAMSVVVALIVHQPYQWLLHGAFWFNDLPEGYGHDLPFIYAVWALAVVLLYFPCAWYARVKREQAKWWMSYL